MSITSRPNTPQPAPFETQKNDADVTTQEVQEQLNSYEVDPFAVQDLVKHGEDYVEFRDMGWLKAGLVSTAEVGCRGAGVSSYANWQSIALGLLSFPSVFYRLGMGGGLIATIALGTLAYITAWQMVDFKLKHRGVMNFADAGGIMWGRVGSITLGTGMILKVRALARQS